MLNCLLLAILKFNFFVQVLIYDVINNNVYNNINENFLFKKSKFSSSQHYSFPKPNITKKNQ